MNNMFKIPSLGNLMLDQIIFETYYPIIFTCLNEKEELFLCVCCRANADGRKWLITKTQPQILLSMLRDEITVREAFIKYPELRLTVIDNIANNEMDVIWNDKEDWNIQTSRSLPDAGEYLNAEEDEFKEEIAYFELMANKYRVFDLKEIEEISLRKVEVVPDFSIEFTENWVDEISTHKQLQTEIYRAVYNRILEKLIQELADKETFLIEEGDALKVA